MILLESYRNKKLIKYSEAFLSLSLSLFCWPVLDRACWRDIADQ